LEKRAKESKEVRKLSLEAEDTLRRIQDFVGVSGDVVSKAKLFDEEIHKASNEAMIKAVTVLAEYSETMEKLLYEIRDVFQQINQYPDPHMGKKISPR